MICVIIYTWEMYYTCVMHAYVQCIACICMYVNEYDMYVSLHMYVCDVHVYNMYVCVRMKVYVCDIYV